MPSQSCINGNVGSFFIANFAHQDHIWILTHNSTKSFRKSVTAIFGHLRLRNVFDFIFNWIFNRDDFDTLSVELVYQGVERSGFARASWASGHNHAMRFGNFFLHSFIGQASQSQIFHRQQGVCLTQKPHHHRFSVVARNDVGAHVDFSVSYVH